MYNFFPPLHGVIVDRDEQVRLKALPKDPTVAAQQHQGSNPQPSGQQPGA